MVFSTRDLGRSPGSMETLKEQVPAPADVGNALIGIRGGSELDLDLRLEAVHEGILVSGTATAQIAGECGRCLDPIEYDYEADIQELFYYEESEEFEDDDDVDQYWVVGDLIDIDPVLRSAVVTALPFQPVCKEDCLGLCNECGINLNDEPEHHHEVLDPRWAALAQLSDNVTEDSDKN
ncbi:DNA-binding protein [Arthrobacter sp. EpRS66]|uniref:YceD family protein n=1 Tax=Glutamicibacter mishrai TaxID=1775880 RepID=UPI0007467FF7|nr:DNA-binding protein [Arthrobacter sp. EpRS66]